MTRRATVTAFGVIVAFALGGGIWFLSCGCHVDSSVAEPYRERDLELRDIRLMLRSGDFKRTLEASKQIDKLAPEEKVRFLLELSESPEAPIRIVAVKKLRVLDDPRAKDRVARMAKDDPDSTVRQIANQNP